MYRWVRPYLYLPRTLVRRPWNYSQDPLFVVPTWLIKFHLYSPSPPGPGPWTGNSCWRCWVPGLRVTLHSPSVSIKITQTQVPSYKGRSWHPHPRWKFLGWHQTQEMVVRRYSFFIHVSQTHELGASAMAHQFPFSITKPHLRYGYIVRGQSSVQQLRWKFLEKNFTKGLTS